VPSFNSTRSLSMRRLRQTSTPVTLTCACCRNSLVLLLFCERIRCEEAGEKPPLTVERNSFCFYVISGQAQSTVPRLGCLSKNTATRHCTRSRRDRPVHRARFQSSMIQRGGPPALSVHLRRLHPARIS